MLKQHNVENAEIPRPFEEMAPEPLIQQHKAVVEAEAAARLARAANNIKKERDKVSFYIIELQLNSNPLGLSRFIRITGVVNCSFYENWDF